MNAINAAILPGAALISMMVMGGSSLYALK